MMKVTYKTGITPETEDIIDLYNSSGLIRLTTNKVRFAQLYFQ